MLAATPVLGLLTAVSTASAQTGRDVTGNPRTFAFSDISGRVARAARYDMLVSWPQTSKRRPNYPKQIKAINPGAIVLMNPFLHGSTINITIIHPWQPFPLLSRVEDNIVDGRAKKLGTIAAVDTRWDYLYNADGTLARTSERYPDYSWNLADPARRGVAEKNAKIFAYAAKQHRLYRNNWDGIWSDGWIYGSGVGRSWFYGPNLDTDRNGVVDDYATMRNNWSNGVNRVGELLRRYLPGMIVGGNGSWYYPTEYPGANPRGWLRSSNLTMFENLQDWYNEADSFISQARTWLAYRDPHGQPRYVVALQDALDCAGREAPVDVAMTDSCVMRSMRWGLTLALMVGAYYQLTPSNGRGLWWFDEFRGGERDKRGFLGQAIGPPVKLSNGIWRRVFARGIALNNSTSTAQTVSLGRVYERLKGKQNPRLNNGQRVTVVEVQPHDGVILVTPAGRAQERREARRGRWLSAVSARDVRDVVKFGRRHATAVARHMSRWALMPDLSQLSGAVVGD